MQHNESFNRFMAADYDGQDYDERNRLDRQAMKSPVARLTVNRKQGGALAYKNGWATATITFMWMHPGDGQPRNYSAKNVWDRGVDDLDNLQIEGWMSGSRNMIAEDGSYVGGFSFREPQYRNVFAINLTDGRGMVKTLNKIARSMKRKKDQHGWPDSFAEYIRRILQTLRCKVWLIDTGERTQDGYTHRYVWSWASSGELVAKLDRVEAEVLAELAEQRLEGYSWE